MLDWFKKLMPKEEKFFDLFEAHAAKAQEAARSLRAIVDGGSDTAKHCATLSRQEEEADAISYEVMQAIRRSFITPFDRSDIKALSAALDDAIDQMNKTAKTVMLYDVATFEPNMKVMADKVISMADLIAEGLPMMRSIGQHHARLHGLTGELTKLEGEADDLTDKGLRALFQGPARQDALAFVIGSEIYDHLEKVCDRFEDVAHVMSDIVIEHV
jgi:predicted phosphate transport protein (TIGR00153 family)